MLKTTEKEQRRSKKGRIVMEEKKNILTYEGLRKYEDELHELKVVKRQEVAQKIKEAREQGDLSENAEYDAAKEEQAEIESRIVVLEKMLRNAEVIDDDEVNNDIISVGSTVKLYDFEFEEEVELSQEESQVETKVDSVADEEGVTVKIVYSVEEKIGTKDR